MDYKELNVFVGKLRRSIENDDDILVRDMLKTLSQDQRDLDGALSKALEIDDAKLVGYLLDNGAKQEKYPECNIEESYVVGTSNNNLDKACINGNLEIVKHLIKAGSDIHRGNEQALLIACENGHVAIIRYFYRLNCDIRKENDRCLLAAVQEGHIDAVKFLVEKGADVRVRDDEPVKLACEGGHLEVVKYLVDKGADARADNDYGFDSARTYGHFEVVKYLVEQGCDVHMDDDDVFRTAASDHDYDYAVILFNQEPEYYSKLISGDDYLKQNIALIAMVNQYKLKKPLKLSNTRKRQSSQI